MVGLHPNEGLKYTFFALSLEFVFLVFCAILIGLAVTEIKRGKNKLGNISLISVGGLLVLLSFYVTYVLIQG